MTEKLGEEESTPRPATAFGCVLAGSQHPRASCDGDPSHCTCVIDISTPATLERDFQRWLHLGSIQPETSTASSMLEIAPVISTSVAGKLTCSPPAPPPRPVSSRRRAKSSKSPSSQTEKRDGRRVKKTGVGTNIYGRRYLPGRPLNIDERKRIIECHLQGMKVNSIAKTLCISHGCVSKIIARYRSTGVLSPASSPEMRRNHRRKQSADTTVSDSPTTTDEPYDSLRNESPF